MAFGTRSRRLRVDSPLPLCWNLFMIETLHHFVGIPACWLMIVLILTRSSLIPDILGQIINKKFYTKADFEDWMLIEKGSFFWHKLYTCTFCHSVHAAWPPALLLAAAGEIEWTHVFFMTAIYFLFAHWFIVVTGNPAVTFEPSMPPADEGEVLQPEVVRREWPSPKKGYTQRLVTETQDNGKGGHRLIIKAADEIAQKVSAAMVTDAYDSEVPDLPALRAARDQEVEAMKRRNPDCKPCEEGNIKRKYMDYAVALFEERYPDL